MNQLMDGDWVFNKHHNKPIRITPYDFFCHRHDEFGHQTIVTPMKPTLGLDLDPIPFTPEIAEKNGFKKDMNGDFELIEEEYGVRIVRRGDVYAFTLTTTRGDITDMVRFTIHQVGPFSVHWVQHALKLCGIKKEIVL